MLRNVRSLAAVFVCLLLASLVLLVFPQEIIRVGYAIFESDDGSPVPVGTALFSFRNLDDILVSEAGVAAAQPLPNTRFFVDQRGRLQTGIAIVNSGNSQVTVTLTLRDSAGLFQGQFPLTLAAGEHTARQVSEFFPGLDDQFTGTLTLSGATVAAVSVRQSENAQGEVLFATLPVTDLDAPPPNSLIFPHLGAGPNGLLSTEILLLNTQAQSISGTISLFSSTGTPLQVEVDGQNVTQINYQMTANGTFTALLEWPNPGLRQGYAVVTANGANPLPNGTAIFRFTDGDDPISEAGVPAIEATDNARIFVESGATRITVAGAQPEDRIQTGVALANAGNFAQTVTFDLLDRNGFSVLDQDNLPTLDLLASGHDALFVSEIVEGFFTLPDRFTGILEIRAEVPLIPITLKLTTNGRRQPILTTLPVADLNNLPTDTSAIFPQIGFGLFPGRGIFNTRLIFLQGLDEGSAGTLQMLTGQGQPLTTVLGGETTNQTDFAFPAGAARQFFPGLSADLETILVTTPDVTVNQGNTFQLSTFLIDELGNLRDEFPVTYESTAPATISVDRFGNVTAENRGFSNIVVRSRGQIQTATITGATITEGPDSFRISGVVQDLSGSVYLSNSEDHTILFAEQIVEAASVWAGRPGDPGLVNQARLQSEFDEPAYVALDTGLTPRLFVSDSNNHSIREITTGEDGQVSTLAGNGNPGSTNGTLAAARFNRPQGIALDGSFLWVADTGNHTIRRIDLASGMVETVAGLAGAAGLTDATGNQARFDSPTGIAIEYEPIDIAAARPLGEEPPPASVIVADTGNDVLRRVFEDGRVETITDQNVSAAEQHAIREGFATPRNNIRPSGSPPQPFSFRAPTGVAVDEFGNIFLTEPPTGTVRLLLRNGQVVDAAQSGTFEQPLGLAISVTGRVVVAESSSAVQEIRYAGPSIIDISPDEVDGRGGEEVVITGANFAPDSLLIVGDRAVLNVNRPSDSELRFTMPAQSTGVISVTLLHRGGFDQVDLFVRPTPLSELGPGSIATIAGGNTIYRDGRPAPQGFLSTLLGTGIDQQGNVYIADSFHHRIRRVDAITGLITTVAGTGRQGPAIEGPAVFSNLNTPANVTVAPDGSLIISDSLNGAVHRVRLSTGLLETLVGLDDIAEFFGFNNWIPYDVAAHPTNGDLFISDFANNVVYRRNAAGVLSIYAGTGAGPSGTAGTSLSVPRGIALDEHGNLFISDSGNHRVVARDIAGGFQVIAGTEVPGFNGDGIATESRLRFPSDVSVDASGDVLIADSGNNRIRRVNLSMDAIGTIAGNGNGAFSGDGGQATAASLNEPFSVETNFANEMFIGDTSNLRIRRVAENGTISTYAGNGLLTDFGDNGPATRGTLNFPSALAIDSVDQLLIADTFNHRVRQVRPVRGILEIITLAGDGIPGFTGDGGLSNRAQLNRPMGLSLDAADNLLISDSFNHRLREVDGAASGAGFSSSAAIFQLATTIGIIDTVAGSEPGFGGDGGSAQGALFNAPLGSDQDDEGNIYIADALNDRIRRITPNGIVTSLVCEQFSFSEPWDVAVDPDGNVVVADTLNNRVLLVTPDNPSGCRRLAGDGTAGFSGDGSTATRARLDRPISVVFDSTGNLYIADFGNARVRRVRNGVIRTVAGSGALGSSGDNGLATSARFLGVIGLAVDSDDNLYLSDSGNQRIRVIRAPIP